ncbi:EAL domain-containing protein [Chelatococcus sambhunathii]|uniref:EAL domain-containing protein n=1 Tax=Chelatococcus sambhunathii TaxID=363953 RepID=A0ABU1DC54_9HYPH|nr:EAL domain-containing protein [Chelatococcus sambhunathii]MDR4305686.1 EAL domain-containing protein [Chelatococcus sambhunathii]
MTPPSLPTAATSERGRAGALDLPELLAAVGEAAYVWDVPSDRIDWTGAAHDVLGLAPTIDVGSATAFAALLDPEALTSRREAVFGAQRTDDGEGVPFEVEYPLLRGARTLRLWMQDRGRWYAGPDGRPLRVVGVMRRLGARYEAAEQAASLARFDPLTGQLSRARLLEIAGAALAAGARMHSASSFVLASLTNLGPINEAYGFDVGDLAILEVSRRLRSAMRGGDTLGRFSTSTFGMVLQECDRSDLEVATRRLVGSVHDQPVLTPGGPISVRVAIGAVVAPRHARDTDEMVLRARSALGRAMETAAAVCIYSPDQSRNGAVRAKMRLADELISALNEHRVRLALQPVVRAGSRETCWSEALLRVADVSGEIASGGHLAAAAEEVGVVNMLDRRMLDLAVVYLAEHPEVRLAINVSSATTADLSWMESLSAWLAMRPDIADRLMVEITETALIADLDIAAGFVRELKRQGVKVAIDDFGSGHSSFKALRELAVDVVKIDGSFVVDIETSEDGGAFVRALIALARELGLETVAEHVETEAAASLLAGWGATYLQGELLGAPKLAPSSA